MNAYVIRLVSVIQLLVKAIEYMQSSLIDTKV
jgi:hypothetical protein